MSSSECRKGDACSPAHRWLMVDGWLIRAQLSPDKTSNARSLAMWHSCHEFASIPVNPCLQSISEASHCSISCWCHLGLSHTWLAQKWGASWAINGFSPPLATAPSRRRLPMFSVLCAALQFVGSSLSLFLRPSRDGILVMTGSRPGNWY